MKTKLSPWLRGSARFTPADALRSGGAALLALTAAGLLAHFIVSGGSLAAVPLLAAPIGASAVLLFAVPASPLAQPRAVIGGNVLSAAVGVTCALLIPSPVLAAGTAVGLAIALMALLGCLHPPGGAVALTAVIGGPAVTGLGYVFVVEPIALCSVLMVLAAVPLNRLAGHSYPHRVPVAPPAPTPPVIPPPPPGPASPPPTWTRPWPITATCWTSAAKTWTPCSARSSWRPTSACTPRSAAPTSCPRTSSACSWTRAPKAPCISCRATTCAPPRSSTRAAGWWAWFAGPS